MDPLWWRRTSDMDGLASIFQGRSTSLDAPWIIAQSSGTTGTPKFMALSERLVLRRVASSLRPDGAGELKASCLFPPMSHAAVRYNIGVLLQRGAVIIGDYWLMAQSGVTDVKGSITHLAGFLSNVPPPERPLVDTARLAGGSPSPAFVETLLRYFNQVVVSYSSTEAGPTCALTVNCVEDLRRGVGPCRAGACVTIEPILGADEGRIRVRTTAMIEGYIGDPDLTAQFFKGGWFYPGDIGFVAADECLHVVGRETDQFNVGGVKVNASALDEILLAHPDVQDAVSFLRFSPQGAAEVGALVSPRPGADLDKLAASLRRTAAERAGPSRAPRSIFFHGVIPRTQSGKPQRQLLSRYTEKMPKF